jgi:hypothetical protein
MKKWKEWFPTEYQYDFPIVEVHFMNAYVANFKYVSYADVFWITSYMVHVQLNK